MEHRSLVITQDQNLIDKLVSVFGRKDCEIHTAFTFLVGLELAATMKFDVIAIELHPPWKKALRPLMVIRRCNAAVLIVLMHHGDDIDRTRCLNYADGFVWLPTKPAKLKKALQEAVERHKHNPEAVMTPYRYCRGLILFKKHERVFYGYDEIRLTPILYKLLCHLMLNKDHVQSRDTLLQEVWGFDYGGSTNTVNAHISKLRAALDEKTDEVYIETARDAGYRFVSENPALFTELGDDLKGK